jgi:hypothetical protein
MTEVWTMSCYAYDQIKKDWKAQADVQRAISTKIRGLKWKEGSQAEVRELRSKRCSNGRPVVGKKALKPFLRPETGPERGALWQKMRDIGTNARYLLLAKGLLRGRTYRRMESKCAKGNKPSASNLHDLLLQYIPKKGVMSFTVESIQGWLDGGDVPIFTQAEPEAPAGVLGRIRTFFGGRATS